MMNPQQLQSLKATVGQAAWDAKLNDAFIETQQMINAEMVYSPHLRDAAKLAELNAHMDALRAMRAL